MEAINNIDFEILDFLQTLHNEVLNFIMSIFTHAGDNGYVWIAFCIILLCIPKTRKIGIYLAITLIVEVILNDGIIKSIIARERPFLQTDRNRNYNKTAFRIFFSVRSFRFIVCGGNSNISAQ